MTSDGLFEVQIECLLRSPCKGALLVLDPSHETGDIGDQLPRSQWVAGSDIQVDAETTSTVPVAMTKLGQRLVTKASPKGFTGNVILVVKKYGAVGSESGLGRYEPATITLTTAG